MPHATSQRLRWVASFAALAAAGAVSAAVVAGAPPLRAALAGFAGLAAVLVILASRARARANGVPPATVAPPQAKRPRFRRYRVLLAYAARYRRGWAAIFVLTLTSTGLALLAPWPMKILVDNVLSGQPLPRVLALLPGAEAPETLLLWVVAGGLFVFAAGSAAEIGLTYVWTWAGQSMVFDVARDVFARIQRRSLLYHGRRPVGDSMGRVTYDAYAVHTVAEELLMKPLHGIAAITGIAVVMSQLNLVLAALSLVVAPLLVASSLVLGKPLRSAGVRLRDAEIDIQSHVQQTLAGMPVVQAFAQESRHGDRFQHLARTALRSHVWSAFVAGLNGLASGLFTTLGLALILFFGAHAVLAGTLTIGGLLVFLAYMTTLQRELERFTGIYARLQTARASIDRVTEVLDAEPEVRDRAGAVALGRVAGHVRLERVTFAYEPGRPVLRDVSLEARPGERVAIVGATGAGKTTLVSLIPRFFDPEGGRVTVDGHDVRDVRLESLRANVSLVLQESFLFPITVADNIAYGRPHATRTEIEQAAQAANAHDFIQALPDGYDTLVGERGATLSGGERQRIAIARALVKDAPILILDEPTSALDAETEHLLLQALDRLMSGRTTFIIAHRLSTIRGADRIIVLEDGRSTETGTHHELLRRGGRYARFHGVQAGARERAPDPTGAR